MEEDLASRLEELRISHDVRHIDSLISNLKASSYVASTTRARVVELIRHEIRSPDNDELDRIFSQSMDKYIPRAIVRKAIVLLKEIKGRAAPRFGQMTTKEEWFCYLVDSHNIVEPLREFFDRVEICRWNIILSLFTIVLFGKLEEDKFFNEFTVFREVTVMTEPIARAIFKYDGGVTIVGSSDCAHLMAGNDMKSLLNSADGTIGDSFNVGMIMSL
jgi:hypothetical protein